MISNRMSALVGRAELGISGGKLTDRLSSRPIDSLLGSKCDATSGASCSKRGRLIFVVEISVMETGLCVESMTYFGRFFARPADFFDPIRV
jgi:hypothetical protein